MKPPRGTFLNRTHPLAREFVGCWLLNEGTGDKVFDYSGNGNNGTLTNMDPATDWVSSPHGGALDFDGSNDHIVISDSPVFDFAGGFTLSVWVNPTNVSATGRIIYRYDATSADGYYLSQAAGIGWIFVVFVSPDFTQLNSDAAATGGLQHIVGVRDSNGDMHLYVDGILQTATGTRAGAIDSTGNLFFGVDFTIGNPFEGRYNGVCLWNRALSAAEVLQLYLDPYAMFKRRVSPGIFGTIAAPPPVTFDALLLAGD